MSEKNQNWLLVGFDSQYLDALPEIQPLHPDLECDAVLISTWQVFDNDKDSVEPNYGNAMQTGNNSSIVAAKDGQNLNYAGANNTTTQPITEIYYGFGGNCVHPVRAGDTSDLIYVQNANQIYVRTNQSNPAKRVFFSVYRLIEK